MMIVSRGRTPCGGGPALVLAAAMLGAGPAAVFAADYSAHVESYERRLLQLGFSPGVIDGRFDMKLAEAIRAFQRSQDMPEDGGLTRDVRAALDRLVPVVDLSPRDAPDAELVGEILRGADLDLDRAMPALSPVLGLSKASELSAVLADPPAVQLPEPSPAQLPEPVAQPRRRADSEPEPARPVGGDSPPQVKTTPGSAAALTQPKASAQEHPYRGIAPSESSPAVEAAERALQRAGYSPGRMDGAFDFALFEAIKAFQRDQGLEISGRLNRETRAALDRLEAPAFAD